MKIAYIDESGDDGYPAFSSEYFVLSSLYLDHLNWQSTYSRLYSFRNQIKNSYGIPIKTEMHTRHFLLNKNPYNAYSISDQDRVKIIDDYCELISQLDLKIINIVIVKPRIQKQNYQVLDMALSFLIQRIENDLHPNLHPEEKFLIITDPGRLGKMRKTTRRMQKINFIPSKFSNNNYRKEIRSLIEDPLPKDSKESYFIQLADLISYIIYLNAINETGIGKFPNRLSHLITTKKVTDWMLKLKPRLNTLASNRNPYGVVYHPY
jgi:hypothetical protein